MNKDNDHDIVITSGDLQEVAKRGCAPGEADVDTAAGGPKPAPAPAQPPPQRRRSLRPTVEPERFVARPSLQGLTVADGDAMYVSGRGIPSALGGNKNDEIKHRSRVMKHEGRTKNEKPVKLEVDNPIRRNSYSLSIEDSKRDEEEELAGKRPQDPQVDFRTIPSASENAMPAESKVDHHGSEFVDSAQDSSVPPALEKSDTLSKSMQTEQSRKPNHGFRNSNNLTNDGNLRVEIVESKLSTPPIDHASEQSLTYSTDVDTKSRYRKRKRNTKSVQEECDTDSDDDDDDGGDYDDRLVSAAPEVAIASRTCDLCGGKNKATSRKCHKCHKKLGNSFISKKNMPSSSSVLGGIVEKENEEVKLIRATTVVALEGSNSRSGSPSPSPHGMLDSQYPRRIAQNSVEEVLPSGLKSDIPSMGPSPGGRKMVPNSTDKRVSISKINTLHDQTLDFPVLSPSHPISVRGYYCRATSCNKRAQSAHNGFCRRHYNRYLVCTGQRDSWTCDCGNRNIEYSKQCSFCNTPRSGASPMSSTGTIISPVVAVAKKGQSRKKANKPPRKKVEGKNSAPTPSASAAASTSDVGFVPPEFANQISPREQKLMGKRQSNFITCNKVEQSKADGFCSTHWNMYSIDRMENRGMETSHSALVSFANVPETTLLEQTRNNLLNGRDCWICIDCAVEVPSITYPCWKCNKMISFVPLEVEEFEKFVQNQREINMKNRRRSNVG